MFGNRKYSAIVGKAPVAVLVGLCSLKHFPNQVLECYGRWMETYRCASLLGRKGALKSSLELRAASVSQGLV